MANRYGQIEQQINELKGDFEKFYSKGNQAAGTRVRKGMQELKVLAQDIRKEVQDMKNNA